MLQRSDEEQKSIDSVKELFLQARLKTEETKMMNGVDLINENGKKIEVKNRRFSRKEFLNYSENDGFMLEKKKYDELVKNNGYYCNTFIFGNLINDEKIEIILKWKFGKYGITTTNFSQKYCPSTTDFNNNYKKNKEVCYVGINDAAIFIRKNNWKKITKDELYENLIN